MQPTVICYVPVKNGTSLNEDVWGMAEIANRIHLEQVRLVGIIVHIGIEPDLIHYLPFDEIYHVKLNSEHWKLADHHIQAFQKTTESLGVPSGTYLFSSSPLYHEVAVRLSVLNQTGIITYAMDVKRNKDSSSLTVKREIYQEKAHEFVTFNELQLQYITLDTAFLYGNKQQGSPSIVQEIYLDKTLESKVEFLSESIISWKDLKITEARCVIGIGRGVIGTGTIRDILQLAELLNAPIGGSKVADELGLIPREKRIGSSGSSIEADIYFAIGISGSSQHLEGIKGVKHVIAINNDPAAPIFQRCDLGIVGDFQDVIPRIVQSLNIER